MVDAPDRIGLGPKIRASCDTEEGDVNPHAGAIRRRRGVEIGKKTFSGIVPPLRRDPAAEARKIRNSG